MSGCALTFESAMTPGAVIEDVDQGFAALYADQFGRLVSFARARFGAAADVEDIVQESFGNLWRRWGTVAQPTGYLWASVMNGCRDDLRRTQLRRRHDHLLIDRPDDHHEYLVDLIAGLGARRREVVLHRFYRGDTLREIAQTTDQPIGTVKSSLHRALADLRRSLDGPTA